MRARPRSPDSCFRIMRVPATKTMSVSAPPPPGRFAKDTLIKGKPARIEYMQIAGQTYAITRGPLTVVSLEDEWYEDVNDPAAVIECLRENPAFRPDIFTFWQRLP